jgi:hypothetical protein
VTRLVFYSGSQQQVQVTNPAPFNYDCTIIPCGEGLECDPQLRMCKLQDGQPCNNRYDCLTDSYCNGTCTSRDGIIQAYTGVTGDPCPCDYRTHICVDGRCLSISSCSNNEDCASGTCSNGTCVKLLMNGQVCDDNIECQSGNCSNGYCQIRGLETGQIGSMCDNDEMCNGLLTCRNGSCRIP